MSVAVIKLGGSLLNSKHLSDWLQQIQHLARERPVIVVPGGGIFAEQVREQQARLNFDALCAHRLALLAMCQFGYVLASLCPELKVIENSRLPQSIQQPLLWLPTELIEDQSVIPASWDYTSDSISLWLANKVEAADLLLIKSAARDTHENTLTQLINNQKVDKGFQALIATNACHIYYFTQYQYASLLSTDTWMDSLISV